MSSGRGLAPWAAAHGSLWDLRTSRAARLRLRALLSLQVAWPVSPAARATARAGALARPPYFVAAALRPLNSLSFPLHACLLPCSLTPSQAACGCCLSPLSSYHCLLSLPSRFSWKALLLSSRLQLLRWSSSVLKALCLTGRQPYTPFKTCHQVLAPFCV